MCFNSIIASPMHFALIQCNSESFTSSCFSPAYVGFHESGRTKSRRSIEKSTRISLFAREGRSAFAGTRGSAMAQAQVKLAQSVRHAAHTASSPGGPSLVKEIVYGSTLGIFVGSFWKMYHINSRRKTEEFYAALEKGELTIEAS